MVWSFALFDEPRRPASASSCGRIVIGPNHVIGNPVYDATCRLHLFVTGIGHINLSRPAIAEVVDIVSLQRRIALSRQVSLGSPFIPADRA
jgi:hypothetical protein